MSVDDTIGNSYSSSINGNGNLSDSNFCQLGGLDYFTAVIVPCFLLIFVLITAGNLLVITAVMRFSELRTPTNHFVVALAIADLVVGLNIPFYVTFYFDVPYVCEPVACQIKTFVAMWATLCSFLLLIGVAVDRYVSIIHPLTYPALVNQRTSLTAVTCISLYSTAIAVLPFFWPGAYKDLQLMRECDLAYVSQPKYAILFCAHLVLSLGITTLLYGYIFREAWRQNRSLAAHMRHETKTALMMVLIFGVSIVSTLPYLLVVSFRYADLAPQSNLSQAKKFVLILYFGKSAINPFIYGWKNRDFRYAFARLLYWIPCQTLVERSMDSDFRRDSAISLSRRSTVTVRKMTQAELPSMDRAANNTVRHGFKETDLSSAPTVALVACFETVDL